MAVSFIGGGNRSPRGKTTNLSQVKFYHMMLYRVHLARMGFEPNLIGTNVCVQNRRVFCLCRLKETKISYIWTLFKVCTEFSINSAFGLDKFHCNCHFTILHTLAYGCLHHFQQYFSYDV
jgi:hypothetical protein